MNNDNIVGLYEHNAKSYEKVKQGFLTNSIVSIIHATGTGKSYNALQLAYDNKNQKITYIVPSNSIIEHLKEIIENNPNLDLKRDFPNLEFITYQSLINMSEDELKNLEIDYLILDEFHHIGAPIWGARINTIVKTHERMKVFGMTAYKVRDRKTPYERDMVNPEKDELFSGSVVSNYDLCDAMIDGVLPKPVYKSGYSHLERTIGALEQKLERLDRNSNNYKELSPLLKDTNKRLHELLSIKDIFKTNIKHDGKYIYFCPVGAENGKNDIRTIMNEAKSWVKEMGLSEEEYQFYISTSEMGENGKKNRKAFYNDEDLDGNKTNGKLRIMFAINQYNEGVHAPGLDGVIMGRGTESDIVFFEQLGRALSAKGKTKEEYDKLYSRPLEELIKLCNKRQIKINNINSKEEIIEQLLAPIIIDLANNIDFIKELEDNLKNRVKEVQASGLKEKRIIHFGDASFDIDMINEDLFKILEYINARLTMTWMDKYELAKAYYEHNGNLDIPARFKTINGYEYDETGLALGKWIFRQRQNFKNLEEFSEEDKKRLKLLENIGMRFETKNFQLEFDEWYNLAKSYYDHYGNLEISHNFRTINGYEYSDKGATLGVWIFYQRSKYKNKNIEDLTEEEKKERNLLEDIDMRFETKRLQMKFDEWYNLAKSYYDHYGNLEITYHFKTKNGYEYDSEGLGLGAWIEGQRTKSKNKNIEDLTEKEKKERNLLEDIGMRFETKRSQRGFDEWYNLAKNYYDHYGDLEISDRFKTKNGYEYDIEGLGLGAWISNQRKKFKTKNLEKLSQEEEKQLNLLEDIGMRFETIDNNEEWNKKYELAKAYYEHYGNLEAPHKFKTKNGYEYDTEGINLGKWIIGQRYDFKNKKVEKLSEEDKKRLKLLEDIGMRFENVYNVYINEEWNKKYELAKTYYEHNGNLDIPTKFKTKNGYEYDTEGFSLGRWIAHQRQKYNGKEETKLREYQLKLLEDIGIKWYINEEKDDNYQFEQIDNSNNKAKQVEILNRVRSYFNNYDKESLPSREEINQGMLDELNHNTRKNN
jgi:superfamily II DNA or RNA helicase